MPVVLVDAMALVGLAERFSVSTLESTSTRVVIDSSKGKEATNSLRTCHTPYQLLMFSSKSETP